MVDAVPDVLALARAQLASGLFGLAEATLRGRIASLLVTADSAEELDAARALLAEALWRQGRALAAGAVIGEIGARSVERRRPLTQMIEAEALALEGERLRAEGLVERVITAVGRDEVWRLRRGTPSVLSWPPRLVERPVDAAEVTPQAASRLARAVQAYEADDLELGDRELALALRLDTTVAVEALTLLQPTLGDSPGAGRLLLFGDLLRAAGRDADASAAFDRAAHTTQD